MKQKKLNLFFLFFSTN